MKKVAVFGARGFVGSEISKSLKEKGYDVFEVTRENFEESLGKEFDYVINAACSGARFKANQNPLWDFKETIEKTARIFYEAKFGKFIQVSSVSSRCQHDVPYGRNRLAAENMVNDGNSLIIRFGPMFGPTLKRGALIDMAAGSKIYFDGDSKYAFSPVKFNADWIARNLDRKGVWEVGAKNSISLKDLAKELGVKIEFEGPVNHQEIETIEEDYPDSREVIDFMKKIMESKNERRKEGKIDSCRICGNSNLIPCINIGEQYLSSIFPGNLGYRDQLKKYPLEIVQCLKTGEAQCGSLQLAFDIDLSNMYKDYPYTSSTNSSMSKILQNVADSGKSLGILKNGDTVLDIGCNDGTLLSFFENQDLNLVGIDPAQNVESSRVDSKRFVRVKDFFTAKNFNAVSKDKAKLIFGIAMFYHLHDPVRFCKDMESILDDEGVVIIQMAYLPAMIRTNMYNNIVHEHTGYYGTQQIKWILDKAGLELFDVELNDVYGGSFRIFARKKGNSNPNLMKTKRLEENLEEEVRQGIFDPATYSGFIDRINKTKGDLQRLIKEIRSGGKKVWVYGASTVGNTIMQFCDIGSESIAAAADSNPFKFGKYMIGSDIPIVEEEKMRKQRPEYLLALPYSFVNAFREREKDLVEAGTKFIVPLPEVKVI